MDSSVQTAIIICLMIITVVALICGTVLIYSRPYRKND